MTTFEVYFFGPAQDAVGVQTTRVELAANATLGTLMEHLFREYPGLAPGRGSLRFAVNREFADPDQPLADGDEIAVIPPVSGGGSGAELVELTSEPINANRVRAAVMGVVAMGGVVTFEGTTRAETHPEHGLLAHLEYEAYGEMAIEQMRRLVADARGRQPACRIALAHRIGIVKPAEVSVMIAVATPHRADAFEVCRWLIDKLKREVPIWKREIWADGSATWVNPRRSGES